VAGLDFFISHASADRAWAEWIAAELEHVGYSTLVQSWDFRPGADFLHEMQRGAATAERTIAVLSPAYFTSQFGEAEWRAAFGKDPSGEKGLLLPVRVEDCQPPGLLATRVYVDLVGLGEEGARRRLLAAADRKRPRHAAGGFPPAARRRTRFPGLGPGVSNLPARNRNFSGRADVLNQLHTDLGRQAALAVVPTSALHGMGGVGKTQLALEYAHRYATEYDTIWWIPADKPTSAVASLAELARRLDVPDDADLQWMVSALLDLLRDRDRWLLIYDNAERPDQLAGLLPEGGRGHVLITSRWSAWKDASPVRLGVLTRDESTEHLRRRTGADDDAALDVLADLLGDLPLALEEAAAYINETGESLPAYVQLVRERSRELFGLDDPGHNAGTEADRQRVATVWSLSLDRVHAEEPAAEALLNLLAFLAPDVPRSLPTEYPDALPEPLASAVRDRLTYNRLIAVLARYSLAIVSADTVSLHRLVQAVIRARLDESVWAASTVDLLRATFPNDSREVSRWPACERLMPHLLAVVDHAEAVGVADDRTGWLLVRAARYLDERGQYRLALRLAERAVKVTEVALGPEHPDVAWRRYVLGQVLRHLGHLTEALAQSERAVEIMEAARGSDDAHVGVLLTNMGLILHDQNDLVGARRALERALLIEETALGPDDRAVGIARDNLGQVLRRQGDLRGAREQHELALAITIRSIGPHHVSVARRRNNLGLVLVDMGDLTAGHEQLTLAVEIVEAALGPEHPETRIARANLDGVLRRMEEGNAGE
jgi:tetratricopeptide (TPR) repeat protein